MSLISNDTELSVEQRLRTAYKGKGLTLRSLGDKLDVPFKTAHRYICGETTVPPEKARILAFLLFDNSEDRKWCRSILAKDRQLSIEEKRERIRRKKEETVASKIFHVWSDVTSGIRVSEQSKKLIQKYTEIYKNVFEEREIEFRGGERTAWVVIQDRRIERRGWNQVANIYPDKMTLYEKIDDKRMLPFDVDFSKNPQAYFAYCKKQNIGPYALLDLAQEAVETSKLLSEHTYESSKRIFIEKSRLELMKSQIEGIRKWVKTGNGKKKTAVINDLKFLEEELNLYLQSNVAIKAAREDLLRFIDSLIESIRKYSPR